VRYRILGEATFVYCEKMDKKEFHVLMKHCFLRKTNTVEAKAWLYKHYLDSAPAKSTVEGDARSGRPKEAVSDENIKKITK
jgi:hypothetical protein